MVRLVGPHREAIVTAAAELLEDPKRYAAMTSKGNPYGDGKAAGRILTKIRKLVGV